LFARLWRVLLFLAIVYCLFSVPFRIAFVGRSGEDLDIDSSDSIINIARSPTAMGVDLVMDSLFFLDILFQLFLFARVSHGITHKYRRDFMWSYAMDFRHGLLFDLLSSLPVDTITILILDGFASSSSEVSILRKSSFLMQVAGLLRCPRLLRVSQLPSLLQNIDNLLEERMVQIKASYRQLMRMYFLIVWGVHVVACLRFILLRLENHVQNPLKPDSLMDQYLSSLYWALYTVSTVGYGNVCVYETKEGEQSCPDFTNAQALFSVCTICLGMFLCDAGVTSTLCNIIQHHDQKAQQVELEESSTKKYLAYIGANEALKKNYDILCKYRRQVQFNIDEGELLDELPRSLRVDILSSLVLESVEDIHQHPMFRPLSTGVLYSIAYFLKPLVALPGSYLIVRKERLSRVYFLMHGTAAVVDGSGSVESVINYNSVIGNVYGSNSPTKCLTICDLFYLSDKDYNKVASFGIDQFSTLARVLDNDIGFEYFHKFAKRQYSNENLEFWKEAALFRLIHHNCSDKLSSKAKQIYKMFICPDAQQEINVSGHIREAITDLSLEFPENTMFEDAKNEIFAVMQKDLFPRFTQSQEFSLFVRDVEKQQAAAFNNRRKSMVGPNQSLDPFSALKLMHGAAAIST